LGGTFRIRLAVPIALIDFIAISTPRLAAILRRAPFAPRRIATDTRCASLQSCSAKPCPWRDPAVRWRV